MKAPGCSFALSERDIHVWTLRIDAPAGIAAEFEPVLVPSEMERAARFRFDHLRRSFVIARGALRCLLGRYLSVCPASLHLDYGSKGKPGLASAGGIEFNVTHSGGLAVFAFTIGCPVGVDLEQIRPLTGIEDIASRFFCPEETVELMSLPPSERERAFFRCWTRKEAYVKATGDGLSTPLDAFRVTLRPDEPAHFVHMAHDTKAASAWTLHDLNLASDYAAALAYRERQRPLSIFRTVDPRELISQMS